MNIDSASGISLSSKTPSISSKYGSLALSPGSYILQHNIPKTGGKAKTTIFTAY